MTNSTTPKQPALLLNHGGNSADHLRAVENFHLSNDEIMAKVRAQIKAERQTRDEQVSSDWNYLLTTKLFNNPQHANTQHPDGLARSLNRCNVSVVGGCFLK